MVPNKGGKAAKNPPVELLAGGGFAAGSLPDWSSIEEALRTPAGLASALFLIVLILLVIGFARRLRQSLADVREATALSARLKEALAASPDGCYL